MPDSSRSRHRLPRLRAIAGASAVAVMVTVGLTGAPRASAIISSRSSSKQASSATPATGASSANGNSWDGVPDARGNLEKCPNIKGAECGSIQVAADPRFPKLGKTKVAFAFFPRHDQADPAQGTITAVEGGPGYSTIDSRAWYLQLFRPLRAHDDILMVDLRGTGRSDAIDCHQLQVLTQFHHPVSYNVAEQHCAQQLGPMASRYGTAFAADDLAQVLDALRIQKIDLYGDSYGTFFSQTFTVRHPDRVRTVTLDAAYPIAHWDPWWIDLNQASNDGVVRSCERDPTCHAAFPHPMATLRRLAAQLRLHPIDGTAPNGHDGTRRIHFTVQTLGMLLASNGYGPAIDNELLAASRAALEPNSDPTPLLRMAAEEDWYWGEGNVNDYSAGLAEATSCNDNPLLWSRQAGLPKRRRQFAQAATKLQHTDPKAFDPLTVDEWDRSYDSVNSDCLRWPAPKHWVPPFPKSGSYPNTPTLVLVGDLDSVTSPAGAKTVASRFPNSTFIETPNMFHVSALGDYTTEIKDEPDCLARIVRRFVQTTKPGDTSCTKTAYPPLSVSGAFPKTAAAVKASSEVRRTALIASGTAGDLLTRWFAIAGVKGLGLRGGSYQIHGKYKTVFTLNGVRWVQDVPVSGTIHWARPGGRVQADLALSGAVPDSHLRLSWNVWRPLHPVRVRGTVGSQHVRLSVPTP